MNTPEKGMGNDKPEMGEQEEGQEMPEVTPGLEETPLDKEKDREPEITPGQRQEIIDGIARQEEE